MISKELLKALENSRRKEEKITRQIVDRSKGIPYKKLLIKFISTE